MNEITELKHFVKSHEFSQINERLLPESHSCLCDSRLDPSARLFRPAESLITTETLIFQNTETSVPSAFLSASVVKNG